MIDKDKDTDSLGYLGRTFQYKVLLELLTDTKFCEGIISYLQSKYFDDDTFKRIVIEIKNYYEKYERVPSIRNDSIVESIKSRISDQIEQSTILTVLERIKSRDKKRNSPQNNVPDDGQIIQKQIWLFIKQQEYKNLGQFILKNTITGQLDVVENIEEKIKEITKIGIDDDMGTDAFSDIDETMEPDYRNTIPTGLGQDIDDLMGGGLGNGEMGFVLAGLGTGKAQPLTAKVLTSNGWILMGDIVVGDEVISSNGEPTKVLGVFPQEGDRDVYRVEFNDGSVTECDINHLWSIRLNNNENFEVKEFNDIINFVKNGDIVEIPLPKPIRFDKNKIHSDLIYDSITNYLSDSDNLTSNDFIKFNMDHLIYNHEYIRLDFLRKYLNKYPKPTVDRGVIIEETNKYYLDKVYELIKSLGGVGEYSIVNNINRLEFTLPDNILNQVLDKYKINTIKKYIKNIQYKGKEKTQCIYIEDESHEYITDDFIVTHNTTILTKIANHAHSLGKNILQVFFEDNKKQIKRKHFAIWSGVAQSKLDDNVEIVKTIVGSKKDQLKEGKLVLVKFPQDENITIPYIKRWILNYQKIYGIKFDMIVLDYIDCVESHDKNRNSDILSNELAVTKAFEAMLADFNIPGWTATQGNRNSLGADVVNTNQMGGSIKKAQKSHFLLSIARSDEQKENGLANLKILKSRFGRDGITFEDCIFDNDSLDILIRRNTQSFNTPQNNQSNNNMRVDDLEALRLSNALDGF